MLNDNQDPVQILDTFNAHVADVSEELGSLIRLVERVAFLSQDNTRMSTLTARLYAQFDLLAHSNINIQNRLGRLEDLNPPPPPGHPVEVKVEAD